jgi:hypothetical protein
MVHSHENHRRFTPEASSLFALKVGAHKKQGTQQLAQFAVRFVLVDPCHHGDRCRQPPP